jgi:BlaI family transcriptional regulator, penicillinase repressor
MARKHAFPVDVPAPICYICNINTTEVVMEKELSSTEFEIVKLLWKRGELSSREIHDQIVSQTQWNYSTTRTVIDRMLKKGYLAKGTSHGLNIYVAKVSKVGTIARQISQFAEKILETDPLAVLPLFSKSNLLSADEISKLRALLETKDREE